MSLLTTLLISSLVGAGINFAGQQIAGAQDRAHSSALQEDAQAENRELRATQYQTAVEDIEKAGLNPAMLYGSGGAGIASTPSSAIANGGAHNASNMLNVAQAGEFLNAITSARALDYKMHGNITPTTRQIYDMSKDIFKKLHAE